jgi:hypothetical protein
MKKDLIMHLRVHKEIFPIHPREVRAKINGIRMVQTIAKVKYTLGITGPAVESKDGVSVCGIIFEKDGTKYIRWGVSMVKGENYNRSEGCYRSRKFAMEHKFVSKHMSYSDAKEFANILGQEVWKHGYAIMKPMFKYRLQGAIQQESFMDRIVNAFKAWRSVYA